jgi:hypothetical protein
VFVCQSSPRACSGSPRSRLTPTKGVVIRLAFFEDARRDGSWVVVSLRFIDLVLGFGCRTEDQFHFKGETLMANKPQPIKTLRAGRIQAAIWENHSDKGSFYNVTVSRSYKDGDTWKSSDSFGRDDLLVLAQLLGATYTFILQKQAEN